MRYEPATRLFQLAMRLAGSRAGLSLDEMADALGIGRRTAERLRDRLEEMFPQLEYLDGDDHIRRWRLPRTALPAVPVRPGAIATLEMLAREFEAKGDAAHAEDLREAACFMRFAMPADVLRHAEPDIEVLMQAEGSAAAPGPRLRLDRALLGELRHAILGMHYIRLKYRSAEVARATPRTLCPYAILYGRRAYLIAHTEAGAEMRLWRLDRIGDLKILPEIFPRREFDLAEFAAQSFGVFQEEPRDVVLRFTPEAAVDARGWLFHPSQTMKEQADGSLVVRFRCGGMRELGWHLHTWAVEWVEGSDG